MVVGRIIFKSLIVLKTVALHHKNRFKVTKTRVKKLYQTVFWSSATSLSEE